MPSGGRIRHNRCQSIGADYSFAGFRCRTDDEVSQFANIAAVRTLLQCVQGVFGELSSRAVRTLLQEVGRQCRNVFSMIAQRGNIDMNGGQPVEEVGSKLIRIPQEVGRPVGGRDQSKIRPAPGGRAHRVILLSLNCPQQLDLNRLRRFSDLIQKQGSTVGLSNHTGL